ncbi:MAG TPA: DNA polymerase I [Bacteroidales bacterium]|nr:DNA polymerase I [Bacteroidales bacterium]
MPENNPKKLFLIDAYALIFRAYYAFIKNPRITSKGLNTSAIFGFLLALEEVIKKQKPTHLAVVFDHPSPTFRHEMFSGYKATRNETPEDIRNSIPYIKQLIEAYRIPVFDCPGFEADDVIGTLARKASEKGFTTYMMTPDKDFAQLVSENVFIFKPARNGVESVTWGVEDIKREFCVQNPGQVIDVLALMGDSSDNIPGAPGIGPKTAMKLISEFGSVEALFDNPDKIKGKCREIIEKNRELIEFSKKLVRIDQNAPINMNEEALQMKEPDQSRLIPLFEELEFKSLINRNFSPEPEKTKQPTTTSETVGSLQGTLFGEEESSEQKNLANIGNVPHSYHLVSAAELHDFSAGLLTLKEFCFNTETTGTDALDTELVGLSFTWKEGEGYFVHFPGPRERVMEILEMFRPAFENSEIGKTGQNLKFDIRVLASYGIEVKGRIFDTLIGHYLLEPDSRHEMNLLAEKYLSYSPINVESLFAEKAPARKSMRDVPVEKLMEYSAEVSDVTWRLKRKFEPEIILEGLDDLAENIEMPLIRVLAQMERTGVKLDLNEMKHVTVDLREDIIKLEGEIYELAGQEFNISSPKQLGDILFLKLKLDEKARMTKTKQFITNEEILQRLVSKHPIVGKVLEYRGLKKLLTTYVEALPQLVSEKTGRIHTCFNQAVAATGRLSSNNPNLQNIPVRDERGRQLRKAFVPDSGHVFLSADYSQIELRLMAHLSQDSSMISDFLSGNDIHAATASKIFGVPIAEVTREMRSRAKTANFGIIYGISSFGLAERLTIGRKEAKELIDGYFNSYPGIRLYMDESIKAARELGYVKTMFGRRRYVRDIHSRNQVVRGMAERNAINAPIQGTAADIIKIAMVRIHEKLHREQLRSRMILQVHDELIFEVWEPEFENLKDMVIKEMSGAATLDVPLLVDWGKGKSWFEAH